MMTMMICIATPCHTSMHMFNLTCSFPITVVPSHPCFLCINRYSILGYRLGVARTLMLLFKDNRKFIENEHDVNMDVERVLQLCMWIDLRPGYVFFSLVLGC